MNNQKEKEFFMLIASIISVITLVFFLYEEGKFNKGLTNPEHDGFDSDKESFSEDLQNICSDFNKSRENFLKDAA